MTYDSALSRLQAIVKQLESDQVIGLEEYKKLAAEANELLTFCRNQLTHIESDLTAALNS